MKKIRSMFKVMYLFTQQNIHNLFEVILGNTKIKISESIPSKKSKFLKKSLFSSSGENFKFNFNLENSEITEEEIVENISNVNITDESKTVSDNVNFQFVPSTNKFKFNFNVENK